MASGNLIKLIRTAKRINQKTVSQKLGISQQAYSKIERSEYIEKVALKKVLDALKSTPEELENLQKILPFLKKD